jgi:hypothetical protein
MDVDGNGWRYSFNGTDAMLLEIAAQRYADCSWDGIVADPSDGDATIIAEPLSASACSPVPSEAELRERAANLDARLKAFSR